MQLGTGLSDSSAGGWALVVAYGDAAAPSRNLSVFDGLQNVGSTSTVTIPLSGFQTPLSGPVTSTVGVVAYEGDLGTLGDGAAIQGGSGAFTALSNAVNPGPPATSASNSNVFNSTISNAGALVTSRTPSFQNNLGYDADLFSTTGVLGNNQTSTQVRLSTSGDAYQPGVVTIATDLYAPRITASKTVDAATASLGDTLTYTVDVQNTGADGATGTTFTDLIPAGAEFVPGSIELNGAPLTDAAGDDAGEFAAGQVVVRLGTLAPTTGSATVSFQVTVATAGLESGATIENIADLAFQAATTGVPSTVATAPATTSVLVPDLAIGKTHAPALAPGQASTYTITVGNVGEGPTSGPVTVTDTIEPPGLIPNGAPTGAGWACSTSGTTITCTRSDSLAAGSDYPPISIPVLVSPAAVPGQLSNTAALQAPSDGNPANNSFTDAGAVSEPAIDLHVEKVVTSTPDFTPVGYLHFVDPVTYRIEVTNNGVADAANVQLTEIVRGAPDRRVDHALAGLVLGDRLQPGHDHARPGAGHDRRTAVDRERLRHLSVQRAAEQHGDRVGPGRHRDQPGRQQRVGHDLHGAVGRDLDHEILRARATGRGRSGHLHADRPQRRARNGGHDRGRRAAGRRCRSPRRRFRSPAGPASVGTSRPPRASAVRPPRRFRSSSVTSPSSVRARTA